MLLLNYAILPILDSIFQLDEDNPTEVEYKSLNKKSYLF